MADKALDSYLNDHLAGATMGCSLAEQLEERSKGTALGSLMSSLTQEIKSDRETLVKLMERLGTSKNPVKTGTGWLAEKASRVKFSGVTGNPELGTFMALETLSLGVEGKIALWRALQAAADGHPVLGTMDFPALIDRGEKQRSLLEDERIAAAASVLREGESSGPRAEGPATDR